LENSNLFYFFKKDCYFVFFEEEYCYFVICKFKQSFDIYNNDFMKSWNSIK